jgi:adenine-specific DNA-methyltransferase
MTNKEDFINAGFEVIDSNEKPNLLLEFLKKHYPQILKDGELKLSELKNALKIPFDEKNNGYGLNFIGRNYAKAKYSKATTKELKINQKLSKNFDETQNAIIKGDNLDSLKILLNSYRGKIKCIYIDPPYNTKNEGFIYPDKFNQEELEALGFENLSEDDFARMEFSFKSKNSHNGWLSFIYPRLKLARDLLSDDGVIFVSIDDNEQANLKILMDEVFGEENFVGCQVWKRRSASALSANNMSTDHEYTLVYAKNDSILNGVAKDFKNYSNPDNDSRGEWISDNLTVGMTASMRPNQAYDLIDPKTGNKYSCNPNRVWAYIPESMKKLIAEERIIFPSDPLKRPMLKRFKNELKSSFNPSSTWMSEVGMNTEATKTMQQLMGENVFDFSKPISLIKHFIQISTSNSDLILDFFAGSGTTAHAVMELNAEDGGNRKFILCQIDEPIDEKNKKQAFDFCLKNDLPPVISSITIERVRRAGEKILNEIKNKKDLLSAENKALDVGFKVFDLVETSKIIEKENRQLEIALSQNDSLSKIYHLMLKVGNDDLNSKIEPIIENCLYLVANQRYYIINAYNLEKEENKKILNLALQDKNKSFCIDGYTASINMALQQYQDKSRFKIIY